MSNYTKENLIPIPPAAVPAGTLAIKVGDEIFIFDPDAVLICSIRI